MAQTGVSAHAGGLISILRVEPYEHGGIVVTSTAVDDQGRLDPVHAKAADDISPPLAWSGVLEAESYALIVEDPDAPGDKPMLHWMVWDIPGTAVSLPQDLGRTAHPSAAPGAVQGRNGHGAPGWTGMAPPPGGGVHHYHFQLFAVNKTLGLAPGTTLEHVVEALKGCTVAQGELVGLYEIAGLGSG